MVGLYIIVCVALGVLGVIGMFIQFFLYGTYHMSNRTRVQCDRTGAEIARSLLNSKGMTDVEVKKASFFWAMIWGNSYSKMRKTVYLRRGIYNRASVTAIGVACQKVGLAEMDRNNEKVFNTRYILGPLAIVGVQFIPIILVGGFYLDTVIINSPIQLSTVCAILSIVIFFCSMLFTFIQIPIEKRAVEYARQSINSYRFLTPEENNKVERYYRAYILDFKMQFIIKLLEMIKFIISLLLRSRSE